MEMRCGMGNSHATPHELAATRSQTRDESLSNGGASHRPDAASHRRSVRRPPSEDRGRSSVGPGFLLLGLCFSRHRLPACLPDRLSGHSNGHQWSRRPHL